MGTLIMKSILWGSSIVILLLNQIPFSNIQQINIHWSDPQPLSSAYELSVDPELVSSSDGNVFAFWSGKRLNQEVAETSAIFLSHTLSGNTGRWTAPVDLFLSPNHQDVHSPRAIFDLQGNLHLFFSARNATTAFGPIYHTWVPYRAVDDLRKWAPLEEIAVGTYQGDPAVDQHGNIHFVFADVSHGRGICHGIFTAPKFSWRETSCIPTPSTVREEEAEVRPRIVIDGKDTLHVVWVIDDYSKLSRLRYTGRAIYYAASIDDGMQWDNIQAIEEIDSRTVEQAAIQPEWPRIALDDRDRLHIIWISGKDMFRWHKWTGDNGLTWSSSEIAISVPYYNGWMGVIADNRSGIQLVSAGRGGVWYASWSYWGGWSKPTNILSESSDDAHYVSVAAVSDELVAVWQTTRADISTEVRQIYYSRASIPFISRRVMPMPEIHTALPTVNPTSEHIPNKPNVVTQTPIEKLVISEYVQSARSGIFLDPLVFGFLAPFMLITIVVLIRFITRNKR